MFNKNGYEEFKKSWQILSSKSHVIVENDTETVIILKAVIFFYKLFQ